MSIWPRNKTKSVLAYWLTDCPPIGYHRLIDSPEVGACVDTISGIISSATIYLMRNTPKGDVRQQTRLSRFVDIDPWPSLGTRASWMSWIVSTMLTDGDGNAYVLPHFMAGEFSGLEPMPGAAAVPDPVTGYMTSSTDGENVATMIAVPQLSRPGSWRGYPSKAPVLPTPEICGERSCAAALRR